MAEKSSFPSLLGFVLAVLLILPLAACATKGDVRDLRDEIRELQARQEALLREIQRQQTEQRDSIRVLSRNFQEHQARVGVQFRNLEDLVLRTEELAGISQQQIAGLRDRLDAPRQAIPPGGQWGPGDPLGGDPVEEVYREAMTHLQRGSVTGARLGFQDVIERAPNHSLAPEARYHLADLLVQEGELEEAVQAFARIQEFHPDADRVPDALYRAGLLEIELGNTAEARNYLERVVNTWPNSGAADLAREALREIG